MTRDRAAAPGRGAARPRGCWGGSVCGDGADAAGNGRFGFLDDVGEARQLRQRRQLLYHHRHHVLDAEVGCYEEPLFDFLTVKMWDDDDWAAYTCSQDPPCYDLWEPRTTLAQLKNQGMDGISNFEPGQILTWDCAAPNLFWRNPYFDFWSDSVRNGLTEEEVKPRTLNANQLRNGSFEVRQGQGVVIGGR